MHSAVAGSRRPFVRCSASVVCAALITFSPSHALTALSDSELIGGLEAWSESVVVPHEATRRLETERIGSEERAWIDVTTTIHPREGFSFRIDAQGGPGRLRRRMLELLREEQRAWAMRDPLRSAFSTRNYQLSLADTRQSEVDVRLAPKRREPYLLIGHATVSRTSGDLLRVEGRLSKTPSFWLRDVTLVRTYTRMGDHVMLTDLESIAKVRWWGSYKFTMHYTYRVIDGVRVGAPGE